MLPHIIPFLRLLETGLKISDMLGKEAAETIADAMSALFENSRLFIFLIFTLSVNRL
jgi:hypothetical protein